MLTKQKAVAIATVDIIGNTKNSYKSLCVDLRDPSVRSPKNYMIFFDKLKENYIVF